MLNNHGENVTPTNNPLFSRNEFGEIVFLSYNDQKKFSVKFKHFKENYHKHESIRLENIEKLKQTYTEQQTQSLATGLRNEIASISKQGGQSTQSP